MTSRPGAFDPSCQLTGPGVSAPAIRARVFVVGCPRSGTTLVQAALAAHPDVYSFPESHFFTKAWGRMWPLRRSGLVSPRAAAAALGRLGQEVGQADAGSLVPTPLVPALWPLFGRYGRAFTSLVDQACTSHGKSVWVEKTPAHLWCEREIRHCVPDAAFVHVLRDGRAVTASLYELCMTNPKAWVGQVLAGDRQAHHRNEATSGDVLDAVVDRWNRDVEISLERLRHPRHTPLLYADLVADPARALATLCEQALRLPFDEAMLDHPQVAPAIVGWRARHGHMHRSLEPMGPAADKFRTVLTPPQQRRAEARLLAGGDIRALLARAGA